MNDEIPGIGHNEPDVFYMAEDRVQALVATANNSLADIDKIYTEELANRASDIIEQLTKDRGKVDNTRTEATKLLREKVSVENNRYNRLLSFVDEAVKRFKEKLIPWYAHLEKEKQEDERKAKEEADRLHKAADDKAAEAASSEGNIIDNAIAADEADKAAKAADKAFDLETQRLIQVKGDKASRARGLRTTWKARITNIELACAYYHDAPELLSTLIKLASKDARGGRRRIPGFDVYYEESVG